MSLPARTTEWLSPVRTEPAVRPSCPKRVAELPPLLLLRLDVVDVDDPRRSRARRRKIRVAETDFERPLVAAVHVEQGGPHAHGLQAREVRQYGGGAEPEREHVETVRPRHERVRLLASEMDEAIASAHLVGRVPLPFPLPRKPRPAEDVEDLLLLVLGVERRWSTCPGRPRSCSGGPSCSPRGY